VSDDPYLIAGTDTFRNTRGITDPAKLAKYETRVTTARIAQLERGEVTIAGRWDLHHLLDHHRHIFQDVYPWAGELRTTNLYKGATEFCRVTVIVDFAAQVFGELAAADHLQGLDRAEFVAGAAHLLSEVNMLHPFREGNGRAQRAFLSSLARHAGWHLDWTRADPARNLAASIAAYEGDERPLAALLDDLTAPDRPDRASDPPLH
jgi:cell filamentation protein